MSWRDQALCAQTDPEAFYPEQGGSVREAKQVCARCEVRVECLAYALDNDERFGVWGGLSERERRRLKGQPEDDDEDTGEEPMTDTRTDDPETVPPLHARPTVLAAAAADVDDDQEDEEWDTCDSCGSDIEAGGRCENGCDDPAEDNSPQTIEALVFRASGSEHKRTQSLGKRINELARELRARLAAEDADREQRAAQERQRAEVAAELAAAEKALAEARERARQLRGTKPATTPRAPRAVPAHDPKAVRAWARANGVDCPGHGRVPARVVEAWAAAQ